VDGWVCQGERQFSFFGKFLPFPGNGGCGGAVAGPKRALVEERHRQADHLPTHKYDTQLTICSVCLFKKFSGMKRLNLRNLYHWLWHAGRLNYRHSDFRLPCPWSQNEECLPHEALDRLDCDRPYPGDLQYPEGFHQPRHR
jgi:hypothetical protein